MFRLLIVLQKHCIVIAVQKSCIHASAVAVFVEWWIVVFVDNCCTVIKCRACRMEDRLLCLWNSRVFVFVGICVCFITFIVL